MNEPVTVTYSLEEVLKRIEDKLDKMEESSTKRFEKVESKLDIIQKDVTDLKIGQARLEEKVDGLGKRLDYQEFINRGVLIGLIVALLGGLAKMLGLIGNP
jgi:phage terminase Nu1 subunit (DNA packaging protein)